MEKSRRKVNGGVWEDGGKENVAEMCGKKTVREFYRGVLEADGKELRMSEEDGKRNRRMRDEKAGCETDRSAARENRKEI